MNYVVVRLFTNTKAGKYRFKANCSLALPVYIIIVLMFILSKVV